MKERFRQFMIGRYGTDSLNQFLMIVSIALFVLYLVTGLAFFDVLFLVVWLYYFFRMMSRNISKRTAENYRFYNTKTAVCNTLSRTFSRKKGQGSYGQHTAYQSRANYQQRPPQQKNNANYRYYNCPQCKQKLRVPRGRGKIEISCPKCGKQFLKKT